MPMILSNGERNKGKLKRLNGEKHKYADEFIGTLNINGTRHFIVGTFKQRYNKENGKLVNKEGDLYIRKSYEKITENGVVTYKKPIDYFEMILRRTNDADNVRFNGRFKYRTNGCLYYVFALLKSTDYNTYVNIRIRTSDNDKEAAESAYNDVRDKLDRGENLVSGGEIKIDLSFFD